jgi:hypothetical protein
MTRPIARPFAKGLEMSAMNQPVVSSIMFPPVWVIGYDENRQYKKMSK